MSKRILQIVETAYRATLEEQDDPTLWLAASLRGNGVALDVLLRGNAVNYLVRAQDASGLEFGARKQTQPPQLARDLERLIGKGVSVFYVLDDVRARGIADSELIDGARPVRSDELPGLVEEYQQLWG